MATRLTEEEVHLACVEIASQGERPTSLNLLEKLGRGSLTTITKYLNSWNASDDAQAIEAESLPPVVQLPPELSKEGEVLLKKMWHVAKNLTDNELEIQREALKQAEVANQSKVEEAFKFSEAQAVRIEGLEEAFSSMKDQLDTEFTAHRETSNKLNEAEKTNIGLTKDNEELKNKISSLEASNIEVNQQKQVLQEDFTKEIQARNNEIRALEIELGKVNEKLSSSVISNNKLIEDLNDKTEGLAGSVVELEKLSTQYDSVVEELKTIKTDLKLANKIALEAEKQVAKLEGKLEVYKSLEKPEKEIKGS